jgi:tRNA(fMet)-specific endonuclease VapC
LSFLLDTNACIHITEGEPPQARARMLSVPLRIDLFVPSIVVFELWYGVSKSQRTEASRERLRRFLRERVKVLDFSMEDAAEAGRLRAALEARKQPIGPYDTLIAGQALARGYTLVTANHREFSRVEGLKWEDWAVNDIHSSR